ncbi:hypothetical protein LJB90_03815 [Eubacteriales bacterium OttesenSCG-928-G02]|nr:hypothetical protein [Eubacteriales bacterium OttesenSCG-928-G02]
MKKLLILSALFVVICIITACSDKTDISDLESSVDVTDSQSDNSSESSILSELESSAVSEESVTESSVDESSENSIEVPESSVEASEPASEPVSEPPVQGTETLGPLSKNYFSILRSNEYKIETTETITRGGEVSLYKIITYSKNKIKSIVTDEGYGHDSTILVKDNKIIMLLEQEKIAYVYPYDESYIEQINFWDEKVVFKRSGKENIGDIEYNIEIYTDSSGNEFTMFFNGNVLEKFRSYNSEKRDDIIISITVTKSASGAVFDIPSDYSIEDLT